MDPVAIRAYIAQMPFTAPFDDMDTELQDKVIFASSEQLRRRFGAIVTDEMRALQTVYMAEGEVDEHSKFKRHGVKSFGLDGMSFSYDGDNISPEVLAMVDGLQHRTGPPLFGRLI